MMEFIEMAFDRSRPLFLNPKQWLKTASGLTAAALLLICGSAQASQTLPQVFSARYEVTHSGLTLGEARVEYRELGSNHYRYSSHTRPLGIATLLLRSELREVSEGRITSDGFRPDRYEYNRTGRNAREIDLSFDWDRMRVIDANSGTPWKTPMPADTLDRMVSQLQLMHDLASKEADLSYPIADGGRIKHYELRITGRETLQTPFGPLETLRITRLGDSDRRSTTFWCAPALGYLPVRIDHREKGDNFTMALRDARGFTLHKPRVAGEPSLAPALTVLSP
jgi:hypothetical protein